MQAEGDSDFTVTKVGLWTDESYFWNKKWRDGEIEVEIRELVKLWEADRFRWKQDKCRYRKELCYLFVPLF